MSSRIGEAGSPASSGAQEPDAGGRTRAVLNAVELTKLATVLGRRWTATIIVTLAPAPMRHGALARKLRGISRKVLHESLNALMADGLVEKVISTDDCGKPATTYGLTPLGCSLLTVLEAMQIWCTLHLDELLTERLAGEIQIRVDTPVKGDAVTWQ